MSSLVITLAVTILVCLMHLSPASTAPLPDIPESTAPLPDIPESTAPLPDIPESTAPLPDIPESITLEVQFFGQEECKGSELLIRSPMKILPGTGRTESNCLSDTRQIKCAKVVTPVKGYDVFIELFESSDCRGQNRREPLPLNLESGITAKFFRVVAVAIPNSPES